jgi:hypothetical protein
MSTKKKAKAKKSKRSNPSLRLKVAKVLAPAPNERIVELHVKDDVCALPEPFVPAKPVPLEAQTGLWDWLKSLWS